MKQVAVVIPCRNEERYIERCVLSVLASELRDVTLKVVICDGLSTDRTPYLVQALAMNDPRVLLLANERQTTPFALNLGIRATPECDIHIILGAHAEVAPDYVQRCVDHLEKDSTLGCVGGIIENVNEDAKSEMIAKAMSSPFGVGNAHFRTGKKSGFVDTVAFGAYPRQVFEKVGYFDEDLTRNQDDEFNYRVTKAGFRILLDPAIRSRYYVRASFEKLARQYYQYGFWKVYVNKKHGAVTTFRQLVPPLFVLFLMSGIFTPADEALHITWIIIFAVYLFGAIVSAARQRASIQEFPGIVWSFLILHVMYGLGYLAGIWRFMILRKPPESKHSTSSR
jgi:glycosyltransferase involved in cell wall biosynthesis